MKLIIDDANIEQIKKIYEFYPVDGVTTNPTILAQSNRNPYDVLKEIREFIGTDAELHVQVVARDAAGMIEDARRITKELGDNTYVIRAGRFQSDASFEKRRLQHHRDCDIYSNAGFPRRKSRCKLRRPVYKPH